MRKFTKHLTTFAALTAILTSFVPTVHAYKFPNSFWNPNGAYESALAGGDNNGIIEYGRQAVQILEGEEKVNEVISALAPRYDEIGKAYARLGMYDAAAEMYKNYIPYAEALNWSDGVKIARAKVLQYSSDIRLFTDGGTGVNYGAKNEPSNGVLFGVCADGASRDTLKNESMTILYQELNDSVSDLSKKVFKEAVDNNVAIELALNCPNEGYDIDNIQNYMGTFEQLSNMFSENPSAVVYLRFAAEFDVWTTPADPQKFIDAYRTVSSFFKSRNSNVAMVWSPNQLASWDINIDDYYPGDEYVDWVGMSFYSLKYFQGNNNITDDFTEVLYRSGINSDPIIAARDIIEKYGDRKPIMLSESGCSHYFYNLNENTSDWAINKLKEVYNYIPMIYPQVKLIGYFDKYVQGEIYDFSLSNNAALKDEYVNLTKGARFIQNGVTTGFAYREIGDNSYLNSYAGVYTYAHIYGQNVRQVDYYIDDNLVNSAYEAPFVQYLDLRGYANGTHVIKAVAYGDGGGVCEKTATVNIGPADNNEIKITVNGSNVSFTQPPILYNDRTMAPLRAVFEALGANVTWDNSSKTAIGTKDGKTVSIGIGSSALYVNGRAVALDALAMLVNDSTLVPTRAIAEAFDCDVQWLDAESTVKIVSK